jgi:hypothetical protein
MLSVIKQCFYPNDLTENAIQIDGEADVFSTTTTSILFMLKELILESESLTFTNLYDTKSHYYITVQGTDAKESLLMTQPSGNSTFNRNFLTIINTNEVDL